MNTENCFERLIQNAREKYFSIEIDGEVTADLVAVFNYMWPKTHRESASGYRSYVGNLAVPSINLGISQERICEALLSLYKILVNYKGISSYGVFSLINSLETGTSGYGFVCCVFTDYVCGIMGEKSA